ncbi:hypothetical protein DFH06DRAFT_1140313 [Mycena polygramma]|nr:hypothetical protein DFH06DRAFT_1140313 [Mycena polygramma]
MSTEQCGDGLGRLVTGCEIGKVAVVVTHSERIQGRLATSAQKGWWRIELSIRGHRAESWSGILGLPMMLNTLAQRSGRLALTPIFLWAELNNSINVLEDYRRGSSETRWSVSYRVPSLSGLTLFVSDSAPSRAVTGKLARQRPPALEERLGKILRRPLHVSRRHSLGQSVPQHDAPAQPAPAPTNLSFWRPEVARRRDRIPGEKAHAEAAAAMKKQPLDDEAADAAAKRPRTLWKTRWSRTHRRWPPHAFGLPDLQFSVFLLLLSFAGALGACQSVSVLLAKPEMRLGPPSYSDSHLLLPRLTAFQISAPFTTAFRHIIQTKPFSTSGSLATTLQPAKHSLNPLVSARAGDRPKGDPDRGHRRFVRGDQKPSRTRRKQRKVYILWLRPGPQSAVLAELSFSRRQLERDSRTRRPDLPGDSVLSASCSEEARSGKYRPRLDNTYKVFARHTPHCRILTISRLDTTAFVQQEHSSDPRPRYSLSHRTHTSYRLDFYGRLAWSPRREPSHPLIVKTVAYGYLEKTTDVDAQWSSRRRREGLVVDDSAPALNFPVEAKKFCRTTRARAVRCRCQLHSELPDVSGEAEPRLTPPYRLTRRPTSTTRPQSVMSARSPLLRLALEPRDCRARDLRPRPATRCATLSNASIATRKFYARGCVHAKTIPAVEYENRCFKPIFHAVIQAEQADLLPPEISARFESTVVVGAAAQQMFSTTNYTPAEAMRAHGPKIQTNMGLPPSSSQIAGRKLDFQNQQRVWAPRLSKWSRQATPLLLGPSVHTDPKSKLIWAYQQANTQFEPDCRPEVGFSKSTAGVGTAAQQMVSTGNSTAAGAICAHGPKIQTNMGLPPSSSQIAGRKLDF